MNDYLNKDVIHINDINLWAHVGVLDHEREFGQSFKLDISIFIDFLADIDNYGIKFLTAFKSFGVSTPGGILKSQTVT